MTTSVYLDHNATAPLLPAAAGAMREAMARVGNPSSVHGPGRAARHAVENSRERLAVAAGTDTAAVVFTSGGTEANNLVLASHRRDGVGLVWASAGEHDSVLARVSEADRLELTADGLIDLDALRGRLRSATRAPGLISVMAANNETGVLQPVGETAALAREYGVPLHCDAAQLFGRLPLDVPALGADFVTLSAHKAGGPPGVGALLSVGDTPLSVMNRGGGQERGRRAGTENTIGIAGFGGLLDDLPNLLTAAPRIAALRDRLEEAVREAGGVRHGAAAPRLPNTSCLGMPGVENATQVIAFDLERVCVSAGAACSSGKVTSSHVLAAMGVAEPEAVCAIRVSLGPETTEEDVDRFVLVWKRIRDRLGKPQAAAWKSAEIKCEQHLK